MNFYWTRRISMPVQAWHWHFVWHRVIGVQIGPWFIGAIRGETRETP